MAKVDLIHPLKGEPGKRYWVYKADPEALDKPRWVQCYDSGFNNQRNPVKYVCREGSMTMIMLPADMKDCRLVEIVAPDPEDVLRYMKKQRLIKPKPVESETPNLLGF